MTVEELPHVTVEELAEPVSGIPTVEELVKLLADPTEIEPPPGNRPGKPKDGR